MAFSKEDRREVYVFFEKLLLDADEPIFYEHLRGHVVKASPVVKRYVTKECKGENLLKYFQTRKNYFNVSLKGEVSLKKSRCRLLSYKSELGETEEANKDEKLNDDENNVSEENFEDVEYSFEWSNSRCYSTSSDRTADWGSVEEYTTSRYKLADKEKEKSDYEELTNKYFCRYLSRNGRVEISRIEVEDLPKKVKRYIKNYVHNKLLLFFKNNSEYYLVDEDKYVSLISPVIKDTSPKNVNYVEDSPVIVDMVEESFDISNAEAQTVENFLSCVEFFVGILKKKSCVPLKNISGSLSQAPPGVVMYLKSNYETYKNFLLFVSCLFTINEREEVSLTKDCYALLKRAKKLLRLKSNAEFWSQPIENIICSLFTTEVHPKIRNSSLGNEEHSSINEQQLEHPVMHISNEDDVYSSSDSHCKISSVFEKWNTSEKEVFEVKSSNDCENVIQEVYHEITLDEAENETPYELENTTASLASDQENCGVKTDTELFNYAKAFSNIEKKIEIKSDVELEIKSDVELEIKSAIESISVLDDGDIEAPVNPVCDTVLEHDEIFNDDNSCILSDDKIIKKQTSRDFIECVFTTQLLCLEIIEREKNLTLTFEYEAVKYFVEILESSVSLYPHGKTSDLNLLKGKIGQASVGVKLFLRQFYKGEKIVLFFQKYDEFILDSHTTWIRLSPHYKKSLEKRRIENENFNKGIKIFHVHSLYNSYFHDIVAEVFDCLSKICSFLLHKSKMKFNRLCGHFSQFSFIQQNFVNSMSGSGITEKLEKFLLYFNKLFHFDDIYIQINPEMDISFFVNSMTEFNKQLKSSAEFKLPYFHHLSDFIVFEALPLDFEEMRKVTVECVQDFFSYTSCFNYSDLPNIIEHEVLHSLILEGKDSQCLIKLIEDCDLFELKNGQIFLKKDASEQESDKLTSHNELSDSVTHITDTYNDNNIFHKESTELEHISEVCLDFNKNKSSLHQSTDIIENNSQSACTDNIEVEHSLEDNTNSKHFTESSLSYCEANNVEESSDPEVDCIEEENKNDEVFARLSSPTFFKDSDHLYSDNDTCITKTEEKSVEGETLSNGTISGLQVLDTDEVENENNSECNSDKSINEGKMNIEASENDTVSREQVLKEMSYEKRNKSPVVTDILSVDNAVEFNTCGNMKSDKKLEADNLEKFSVKNSHTGEAKEESEAIKSDTMLEKAVSKFMSEPNLPSDKCETQLVNAEPNKLCDGDLTFKAVKKANELFEPLFSRSYESLTNTTASSNNKKFEVSYGYSWNSEKCLQIDPIKISSTTCDDKSVKIARNTHSIPNDESENNKENFDGKIVVKSYASDSDLSKNDEIVTKFKEKDEICTSNDNYSENLSENSPGETRPACLISKNSLLVSLLQDVKNGEEKENSKLPETASENTSGDDKENIEKSKLNVSTCLNTENTVKINRLERSKTKSTKYNNTSKVVHVTVKDEAELKETTNEDSPFLDDVKKKSKNACINKILKSNNIDTKVDIGDHVKGCSKEKLLQAKDEARISEGNLQQFKDDTTRNKSSSSLIVPECSKLDHKVSVLTCNETTDDKSPLKKEQDNDFKSVFNLRKNMPEESKIESKSDSTTDLKSSHAPISDSRCHNAQTEVQGTHSNFLLSSHKLPETNGLKQYFDENCSSDLSNQNLNLQPLQCKVILLTVDSCIAETVINDCKKYIFCLKSSFFCDEHMDCLCFNNLIVGDSVQCYIPPGTRFNNGNMCISFMICRNSNVSEKVKSEFSPQMPSEELHLDNSKSLFKEVSSTIPNYLSLKQIRVNPKMSECQTDISGEIKHCSSVAEKECLAKFSTVSQSAQTVKYRERKQDSCNKSLQTQVSTALQSTQTIYKSIENECQTVFSGEVKPCSFTDEKACQVQGTNNSLSTQTSTEYDEKESQTVVNTPALISSECNTDLSGPVSRLVHLVNKSSQVSSLSSLVCQTTQTVPENATALRSRLIPLFRDQQLHASFQNATALRSRLIPFSCDQQLHASFQNATLHNKSALTAERAYQMCDVGCQTVSTGAIMIKKYYMF